MPAEFSKTDEPFETPDPKATARLKLDTIICRVTVVMVLLLAVASFALSFEALSELAANSGAIAPGKSWLFPLLIDGAVIISSADMRATRALRDAATLLQITIYDHVIVGDPDIFSFRESGML